MSGLVETEEPTCPAFVDLREEFQKINTFRTALSIEAHELDEEIAILQEARDKIAEPYLDAIKKHEDNIKTEVKARGKSFTCPNGRAIYRKGSKKVNWNDDALEGYSVDHPEIKQFRSESVGKPSVVLTVGEQK